jgi:hypothetical protein
MTWGHCWNILFRNNGNLSHCWNTLSNGNRGHCSNTLLQQWEPWSLLGHIVTKVESEVIDGSHQCRQITLQQWPWVPWLDLLLLSSKSDWSSQFLWAVVFNEAVYWHRPWCGVKNTFGSSVYSEQYIFPILFYPLMTGMCHRVRLWMWLLLWQACLKPRDHTDLLNDMFYYTFSSLCVISLAE